jgi:probable HAF family extracellular repeat protein
MKRVTFALVTILLARSFMLAATPKNPPNFSLPVTYNFVTINYPDSEWDLAIGINDSGYIVGYQGLPNQKGFTLVPSESCPPACDFKPENYPGSTQTGVSGINNDNESNSNFETAGWWVDKTGNEHGFMRSAEAWIDVDYPGTIGNSLNGLNDNNVAAGAYRDGHGNSHPYIYSQPGNQYIPLIIPGSDNAWATGINDFGVIVGTYIDSSGVHGFEISGPNFISLNYPAATLTYVNGINNYGAIVGYFTDTSGYNHGFIYYGGMWEPLDDALAVGRTFVWGINDDFEIVGSCFVNLDSGFGFKATPE